VKYVEARLGRVFVVRLEDGEVLHEMIEEFAEEQKIEAAAVMVVGGIGKGSRLVVGPRVPDARPVVPMEHVLDEVHEISGVGTVFLNEEGRPVSHIHVASGRGTSTKTGCIRRGVKVWQVAEVVIIEILGTDSRRRIDRETGFELLDP
jgi:predicted DNA-binding protein with PD1-like motif